ncbi:MAG: hypothetical protein ACRCYX_02880 [Dermatophilaceae bacterium]
MDAGELLWRSVHPTFLDGSRITSQAFTPTPKDEGRLSTARSTVVTAADHHDEFCSVLGLPTAGVWAVGLAKVRETGLRAVDDSASNAAPDPCPTGHAYVDFRAAPSRGAVKRAASGLRDAAQARGRIHPAIA